MCPRIIRIENDRASDNTKLAPRRHGIARVKNQVPDKKILDIAANSFYAADGLGSVADPKTDIFAQ